MAIIYVTLSDGFIPSSSPTTSLATTLRRSPLTIGPRRTFFVRVTEGDDDIKSTEVDKEIQFSEVIDAEMDAQMRKAKKVAELKAQEVFIKRETGVFKCNNCGYEYVEAEGDTKMIGGVNPPGTTFVSLPANYRCPTCRASKDNFAAVIEEIAGFEVNQGYGFGTNSMTGGQKNLLIFGGLGFFFVLFLGGYAMS